MKRTPRVFLKSSKGFTIIEVLVVLSIAAMILVIILLALPAAQRQQRNYRRRRYVGYVYAQLEAYHGDQKTYPGDGQISGTTDDRCTFIQQYLSTGSAVTCTVDGTRKCIFATINPYDICYHDKHGSHNYEGDFDEISIEPGHFCTDDPTETDNHVLKSIDSSDNNIRKFAVWTTLENAPIFCVDNADRS